MAKKTKGLVIVFTGNGKGKTTAALGMALRFVGHGKRALIVQFIKNLPYGEVRAARRFGKSLVIRQMGAGFCRFGTGEAIKKHKRLAEKALSFAVREIKSGRYHLVVLDEVNCAVHFGLVKLRSVLEVIRLKPKSLHLVLTGRWAPKPILKKSDLVTEMKEGKHPYRKGVKAQKGIEF